jgi:nucleoside-diphosphate-sugar epimerase
MKVLVTGGSGFIGTALSRRLLADGHDVRILALRNTEPESANVEELVGRGAVFIEGSVGDGPLRRDALDAVDVVHHIAAVMREADIPDAVFWDINVAATKELVEECRDRGVSRFVYCSTMGVTGDTRGTKAAAEEWLLAEAERTSFPATAVRPADVYGPGDRRLLKLFRMIQKGTFVYLGSGAGRRHMVYIDDLVDGMLAAQNSRAAIGEAFLLAGPAPIALRDLVERIATALSVPAPRRRLPFAPVRALSVAVEAVCRPLGVQPPIYPRRVDFYAHDYEFDIGKESPEP